MIDGIGNLLLKSVYKNKEVSYERQHTGDGVCVSYSSLIFVYRMVSTVISGFCGELKLARKQAKRLW